MKNTEKLMAPFPYFGGKRSVVDQVWARLGSPKQYIEPFCGSAVMLLCAPKPASLEVVCDANGFIANFWRATKHQPAAVAEAADYPVSHIDQGARHKWLMEQRERLGSELQDPDWPGDAKVAGWWLWGQCSWIGSGWCEWGKQIPHVGNAGRGVQAIGKIPHVGDARMGIENLLTSGGRVAWYWLHKLADRLERVRVVHGNWNRCLNSHHGGKSTAVFLDPPYKAYEKLYGVNKPVAAACEKWAKENSHLRIALCGHVDDYDLPGWDCVKWSRGKATYSGVKTKDKEAIWFSPECDPVTKSGEHQEVQGQLCA